MEGVSQYVMKEVTGNDGNGDKEIDVSQMFVGWLYSRPVYDLKVHVYSPLWDGGGDPIWLSYHWIIFVWVRTFNNLFHILDLQAEYANVTYIIDHATFNC